MEVNQNEVDRKVNVVSQTSESHVEFKTAQTGSILPAIDVIIVGSQTEPKYESWNEINSIEPKNLKLMPINQYVSIPHASTTYVMVSHILENILCPNEPLV